MPLIDMLAVVIVAGLVGLLLCPIVAILLAVLAPRHVRRLDDSLGGGSHGRHGHGHHPFILLHQLRHAGHGERFHH